MTTALVGYYDYDALRLRYRANAAPAALGAYVLYEFDEAPGKAYRDDVAEITTFTTTWAESLIEGDPPGGSGGGCKIVGGGVWIRSSATSLVKGSMYARLLVARANSGQEECLACGYIYDAKPFLTIGEHADLELSEAVATMDVTLDQANVAAGAVVVDVTPTAGSSFELLTARMENSGTNSAFVRLLTTGNAIKAEFGAVGSGAATILQLPTLGSVATSTNNKASSDGGVQVYGTDKLTLFQGGAGAQGDDLRVVMNVRVRGALPTPTKARSTNEADVTVTAGVLSFAFIS